MRDITLGDTIYGKFTTRQFSTGAPFTLAGTPSLAIYEDENLTQITAGVTLTVDYDSVTGLNSYEIVATAGNGYEAGKTYSLVIVAGTVDSVSVVGEVIEQFTVEQSAAVDDIAGLNDPTAATIADSVWDEARGDHVGAGSFGEGVKAESLNTQAKADVNTEADTALTDYDPPTNTEMEARTLAAAAYFDPASDTVTVGTNNDKTGYSLSSAGIQAIWDALTSALTTASSIGKLLVDNINATISSRSSHSADDAADSVWDEAKSGHVAAGSFGEEVQSHSTTTPPTAAAIRAEIDSNSTQLAAIVADTNELQGDWANGGRLDLLIDAIKAETDKVDATIPDSVPADGSRPTPIQALYMINQFLYERAVSGTTVTVKKADGSTALLTLTLDDGSSPTSITRAT